MGKRNPQPKFSVKKFVTPKASLSIMQKMLTQLDTQEIALVTNPAYIYAPVEFYPLALKYTKPLSRIVGIVQDMDGTTTTTELLCVHALEWMVRRITGQIDKRTWLGLNRTRDYPHIIGNSTTKHVEYLIKIYEKEIKHTDFINSFFEAVIWTLTQGQDQSRRQEIIANIHALGIGGLFEDSDFKTAIASRIYREKSAKQLTKKLIVKYGTNIKLDRFSDKVRAGLDIYYHRYHTILMDIAAGRGRERAREFFPASSTNRLIEPMPAIAVFLALIKGWLGKDLEVFYSQLTNHVIAKSPQWKDVVLKQYKPRLAKLGQYFSHHPAKNALVTSSVAYEANIILTEVFKVIREQIAEWQISDAKKIELINNFKDYRKVFDGYITASDSSEIRLKPHRDLYSLALHQMGVAKSEYQQIIGFEDSESGTIALRAAGIGISVAVPFADTATQDLSAATYILHGQLPEAILAYNCFLDPRVLDKSN